MKDLMASMIGFAIGDAAKSYNKNTELFNNYKGIYSCDTSLCLCELESLTNGLNYQDIMNKFVYYCNSIDSKDLDKGTTLALEQYKSGSEAFFCGGDTENGTGALKRMIPVLFYLRKKYGENFFSNDISLEIIDHMCGLTHGHLRNKIACFIYIYIANQIIMNKEMELKDIIQTSLNYIFSSYKNLELDHYSKLSNYDDYLKTLEADIKCDGYIVNALEVALWCLGNTKTFEDAIKKGCVLSSESDAICSVIGGLAGIYYGYDNIPTMFIDKLYKFENIKEIVEKFYNA